MKSTGSGKQKFDLIIIHTACAAQASWLLTKILKLERLMKNHLRDAKPANDIQLKKQINNSQSVLHRWACRQILVAHLTKKKNVARGSTVWAPKIHPEEGSTVALPSTLIFR